MDFVFTSARFKMAEGVRFEPTVGFPTLDFESSALNRTQPPFLDKNKTPNVQRPISHDRRTYDRQNPVCEEASGSLWANSVLALASRFVSQGAAALADRICLTSPKNVTILGLPRVTRVLHLVCAHGQSRYYLLFTGIHRFLAPLFTSMPNLFGTSNPPSPP